MLNQFEELVRQHADDMYRVAYRISGNKTVAEDIVQDLFLSVYPQRSRLQQITNQKAWLIRILHRRYIDHIRKERNHLKSEKVDIEEMAQSNHFLTADAEGRQSHDPSFLLEDNKRREAIFSALHSLNEDHRLLIIMHDLEGYSLPEVQEITGLPLGTLKSRLHRGRRKLEKLIAQNSSLFSRWLNSDSKGEKNAM